MSKDDKEVFAKARPFIVGIAALLYDLFQATTPGFPGFLESGANGPVSRQAAAFERAEAMVAEFEKRS
jgi:hypothetical protein